MLPEPLAARPIAVLLFVHVTEAPVFTEKLPTLILSVGHTLMSGFCVITLSGLIVIVKEPDELVQPSLVAVKLMVPTIAEPVLFVGAVKIMSPVPDVAIPIDAFVLVQLITAPATLLVNGILIDAPGQNV